MKKTDIIQIALLVALTGYGVPAAATSPDSAPAAAAQTVVNTPPAIPDFLTGEIVETVNAAGYTYILLDTGSKKIWAATNITAVETGQRVSVPAGEEMTNFHSKALDRTFDSIYFVSGIYPEGALDKAATPGNDMSGSSRTAVTDAHVEGVARAPEGYTVEEILEQRSTLSGQKVKVRGQVVKFTADIMGTNWMHIQDGTAGDLAVTTDTLVTRGDVITVEGILAVDKDFGAGYLYPAIIEKATVTKE